MSSESSSTIGKQRQSNYALLARTSEEFVHLLDRQPSCGARVFRAGSGPEPEGRRASIGAARAGGVHGAGSPAAAERGRGGSRYAAGNAVRRCARAGVGSYRPHRTVRFVGGADSGVEHATDHRRGRSGARTRIAAAPGPRRAWKMWPATWRMVWPVGSRAGYELDSIPQITVQDFVELREPGAGSSRRAGRARARRTEPVERSRNRCASRSEN